jgi:hypothetical protein
VSGRDGSDSKHSLSDCLLYVMEGGGHCPSLHLLHSQLNMQLSDNLTVLLLLYRELCRQGGVGV